jgi:hypothetical protein
MRTVVFDIETKKEFAEVGGAHNRHLLEVSVIGYWDSDNDSYATFEEHEVLQFGKILLAADCVIGFNSLHFDLPVLQPYLPFDVAKVKSLDLMRVLEGVLGHRISLDACCSATLGATKSADGLEAVRWFRQGEIEKVKKYCLDDVRLTKELWEYGCEHGQIFYKGKDGERHAAPVAWGSTPIDHVAFRSRILEAAGAGMRVEIEYVTKRASGGSANRNRRKIDVIDVQGDVVNAYCHLRSDTRRFQLNRITDVVVLDEKVDLANRTGQYALFS